MAKFGRGLLQTMENIALRSLQILYIFALRAGQPTTLDTKLSLPNLRNPVQYLLLGGIIPSYPPKSCPVLTVGRNYPFLPSEILSSTYCWVELFLPIPPEILSSAYCWAELSLPTLRNPVQYLLFGGIIPSYPTKSCPVLTVGW